MKKRLKAKLVALLFGLIAIFTLAGCQLGVTVDQIMSGNNLQAQVTYYANGGKFNGGKTVKTMHYKSNTPIFEIKETSVTLNGTATVERSHYDLIGWYEVELNEDGTPKFVDEENLVPALSDTPVDFTKRIEKGDEWHIGAKWQARVQLLIQLVCEEGIEIVDENSDTPYKNGEILNAFPYDAGSSAVESFPEIIDKEGGQVFVEYYNEPECITPVDFPVKQLEGQTTDRTIYAKYIDSSWKVIRDANQFKTMWNNHTAGEKYYLARDIDMNRIDMAPMAGLACTLQGNGYKVSNLTVEKKGVNKDSEVSFFGNIAATAVMENVTFENAKAEYYLETTANPNSTKIHFVFTSLAEGADIENVVFSGDSYLRVYCQMNTVYPYTKEDAEAGKKPPIDTAACLFGGFANDSEYTTANENGFKVEFATENLIKYR